MGGLDGMRMQAGDEFVTELDVSELAPVPLEPGLGAEDGGAEAAAWSSAGGADGGGGGQQKAGQLSEALREALAAEGGARAGNLTGAKERR